MGRDFRELLRYAHRDYKFIQADSYALVADAIQQGVLSNDRANGVCAGVVLKWINEKLTTSNSLTRKEGRLFSATPREFSHSINPIKRVAAGLSIPGRALPERLITARPGLATILKGKSHARNEQTMRSAADVQTVYASSGLDEARQGMNLVKYRYVPRLVTVPDSDDMPLCLPVESIAAAAVGLPSGVAAYIHLRSVDGGAGHAIGLYRSRSSDLGVRGNTLYFFDPNAGVYHFVDASQVNVERFVKAWREAYIRYERPIEWTINFGEWCVAFKRPESF